MKKLNLSVKKCMGKIQKFMGIVLAVAITALTFSSCTQQKAKLEEMRPAPMKLSVPEQKTRESREGDIFVSPDGDDRNPGTQAQPVASPKRALELARGLAQAEKVVTFAGGEYSVRALTFTPEDSGVTFYAAEEAVFNGGVSLKPEDFEPYRDGIRVLDLKKYRVTREAVGEVKAFGQYNTAEKYDEAGSLYTELFCGDKRMTLARYPNTGESLKTGAVLDNGDSREVYTRKGTQTNAQWDEMKNPKGGAFGADSQLIQRMKTWTASPDIWMFGYFQYDWADSTTPLAGFDEQGIRTKYASVYGFKENAPYYFFNVFEELDTQTEWYIDRDNLLLYFMPPEGFEEKSVQLTLETQDLVTIDGAQNVVFDGITLTGTRANAIRGQGNDLTMKNCTVKNVGESAVELEGERLTIENNVITATGKAGVVLTGGDRETLTPSGNIVTNNLIYDWSQVYRTYQAAVSLNGVGAVCSHNEIYKSPHEAITYTGNNHVIEYNVIHDVVQESSDAGAIYAGRSWSAYGNIIRYNCIYNIGSGEFTPNGIYFDDALSGQTAYGNLLVNIPGCGFLIGGGRDMAIENNLVVNAAVPFAYDDRAIAGIQDDGWFIHANTPGKGLWATLHEVDTSSGAWLAAYPGLSKLSEDFQNRGAPEFAANPANSSLRNNLSVNSKKTASDISKRAKKYSEIDIQAYAFSDMPFEEEDSYALKNPPAGFEQLPMEQMGRLYQNR